MSVVASPVKDACGRNETRQPCSPLHPGRATFPLMTNPTTPKDMAEVADRLKKMQRAIYYLIWRRSGFGEQCIHCGHSYPGHENRCKAAEIEELVR
jgi:hypothetical protein